MLKKNLKTLRKWKGWNTEQVAAKLKIKNSTYNSYEYAGFEPKIAMLIKIADLYGITVDQLIRKEIKIEIKK